MKFLLTVVCLCFFITSCTISSKNQHYQLTKYTDKDFEKEHAKWCFNSAMHTYILFCSPSFSTYSTSVGFVFPIFPIKDRESKWAIDKTFERFIEISNQSSSDVINLSNLNGIQLCDNILTQNCSSVEKISLAANRTIILKLPDKEKVKILFEVNEHIFYETLEQFSDKHWSLVFR